MTCILKDTLRGVNEVRQTEVYARWFASLRDQQAKARINIRIRRLSLGNLGDVRPVGEGVSELRIDYGPATGCISRSVGWPWWSCSPEATRTPKTGISEERLS